MGMSMHVFGIAPPDETWQKMYAVYKACNDADVATPAEVDQFFGGAKPDPAGVVIDLTKNQATKDYSAECETGFDVDITKLPKHIKIIRFMNSW